MKNKETTIASDGQQWRDTQNHTTTKERIIWSKQSTKQKKKIDKNIIYFQEWKQIINSKKKIKQK